ncbi:MAG TPA: tetratricopeptide repeat protein [Bacillota bacterium]|nr:tetratricopeptide repeat protein [Bacillota bacterium]
MFIRKKVRRSKLTKGVFITIVVLIAVGMVIPLAGLIQREPDGGEPGDSGPARQTVLDRLASLEARVRDNPSDTALLMDLAGTYRQAGMPDQAVKTYERVLSLNPAYSEARIELAYTNFYSGKIDQAATQLQELIKSDPGNKDAHYLYGIILGEIKKDYSGGIREMEKFIALAKEGPEVEKARQRINVWKAASAQK